MQKSRRYSGKRSTRRAPGVLWSSRSPWIIRRRPTSRAASSVRTLVACRGLTVCALFCGLSAVTFSRISYHGTEKLAASLGVVIVIRWLTLFVGAVQLVAAALAPVPDAPLG